MRRNKILLTQAHGADRVPFNFENYMIFQMKLTGPVLLRKDAGTCPDRSAGDFNCRLGTGDAERVPAASQDFLFGMTKSRGGA